jgi:hypothetical protein
VERSAFFNSVAGDRKYKAEIFAGYFSKFITNGVFPLPADNLRVAAYDRMRIKAHPGTGYINGYLYENTDTLILTVPTADGVKPRLDRVVLRWSQIDRNIRIRIKEGIPDADPSPPSLERTADIYELGLADLYVAQGAYEIKEADITDTRLETGSCGIVNSLLQADTSAIFSQYLDWFNTRTNEYDARLNAFLTEYAEAKAEWLEDMYGWFTATTIAFEEELFDKQVEYKALAEGYLAEIEALIGDVEAGELLNRVRWLQENLGFIPIDDGDFFEDYIDFSPDGGKF